MLAGRRTDHSIEFNVSLTMNPTGSGSRVGTTDLYDSINYAAFNRRKPTRSLSLLFFFSLSSHLCPPQDEDRAERPP